MHCGLALLTLLLHVAGLFVLLNAEFLFAVRIIVYAGAILVLYLFVLMLLNLKSDERYLHTKYAVMLFAAIAVCGELVLLIVQSPIRGDERRRTRGGRIEGWRQLCRRHQNVRRVSVALRDRRSVSVRRNHRRDCARQRRPLPRIHDYESANVYML